MFGGEDKTAGAKGHATIEVTTDVGWIGPSQEFHLIVVINPDAGWHTYWENPGDSGAATEITIQAPEGFKVGKPVFPRPEIFRTTKETTYGYSKQAAIFVPVTAPASTPDGQAEFQVTTNWLACKKNCVLGENETTLRVSIRAWEEGPLRKSTSLERWQQALPKHLSDLEDSAVQIVGNLLKISGKTEAKQISFMGIERPGVRFMDSGMPVFDGNLFTILIPIILEPMNAEGKPLSIEGLLTTGRNTTDPCFTTTLVVDNKVTPYFGKGSKQ